MVSASTVITALQVVLSRAGIARRVFNSEEAAETASTAFPVASLSINNSRRQRDVEGNSRVTESIYRLPNGEYTRPDTVFDFDGNEYVVRPRGRGPPPQPRDWTGPATGDGDSGDDDVEGTVVANGPSPSDGPMSVADLRPDGYGERRYRTGGYGDVTTADTADDPADPDPPRLIPKWTPRNVGHVTIYLHEVSVQLTIEAPANSAGLEVGLPDGGSWVFPSVRALGRRATRILAAYEPDGRGRQFLPDPRRIERAEDGSFPLPEGTTDPTPDSEPSLTDVRSVVYQSSRDGRATGPGGNPLAQWVGTIDVSYLDRINSVLNEGERPVIERVVVPHPSDFQSDPDEQWPGEQVGLSPGILPADVPPPDANEDGYRPGTTGRQ